MTQTQKRSFWLSLLAIVLAMISIQSGAALAKSMFGQVSPEGMTVLRISIAAGLLTIYWKPWRNWPKPEQWKILFLYGVVLGVMNLLFYKALERIPLGVAVAIEFVGPMAVAIWNSKKARDLILVALAIFGLYLLSPSLDSALSSDLYGLMMALGAGVCWGIYIIVGHRAGADVHGGTVATIGMWIAAFVVIPASQISTDWSFLRTDILGQAFLVAIFSSAVPYSLEMFALKNLSKHTFGILMSIEPAIAASSGFFFLREALSPSQLIGIALVMAASAGTAILD